MTDRSPTGIDLPHWTAEPASDDTYDLAEGPVWDAPRNRILWVDINVGHVMEGRLDGDRVVVDRTHRVEGSAGAVAVSEAGELLVAGTRGLHVIELDGSIRSLPPILGDGRPQRFNDGKPDPAGRFVVGSMDERYVIGDEQLVRCELDGSVTVLDHDLGLSNGLAWTADRRTMYSIDTKPGQLWARDYDVETGATGPRRLVRAFDGENADGMCLDTDGQLWIAFYGPGEVRRYTPEGELTGVVEVASPHTTSCAFVGADLDRMLITSASQELEPDVLRTFPDAGRLFLVDVGARGLPEAFWSGRA
jgi:sugar lactone lactonase YvrE